MEDGLAGYGWRVLGFLLDALIVGVVANVIVRPLHLSLGVRDGLTFVVAFAYATALIGLRGQTLGMMATRTHCVRADGRSSVDWTHAAGRAMVAGILAHLSNLHRPVTYVHPTHAQLDAEMITILISGLLGIPYLLDLLWPLWDTRNQTLHDKVAKTIVIRPQPPATKQLKGPVGGIDDPIWSIPPPDSSG